MYKQRDQRGASLLEMMVTISIIMLLATAATVMLSEVRRNARDTIRMHDIKVAQQALAVYFQDHGSYPATPADPSNPQSGAYAWYGTCAAASCHDSWGLSTADWIPQLAPQYLSFLPIDPAENNCNRCYLYYSNSLEFKLLAHVPEEPRRSSFAAFIDPRRDGGIDDCVLETAVGMPWAWAMFSPGAMCW